MQSSYDFLLQPQQPGPFELERVETALRDRGAVVRGDGALLWKTKSGEAVVLPFREAGQVTGLDIRVSFSERTEPLTELLTAALALAAEHDLKLVDPQLGRVLREAELGAVVDEYLRISRYAGAYFGLGDAVSAAPMAPPEDEGLSTPTKLVLVLLVFAVAVAAGYQYVSKG